MIHRRQGLRIFGALCVAIISSYLFLLLFRESYAWLSARYQGAGDYRVYLKMLWAAVFAFSFDQSFRKLGLQLPRRDSLSGGVLVPFLMVLIGYQAVGYYLGWDAPQAWHYLCVGIGEELFLNGFLIARLRPLGVSGSAYVSCLIFATFHLPHLWMGGLDFNDLETAAGLMTMGIFQSGVRYYTDSLLPGIVIHALLDYMANFYSPTYALFGAPGKFATPFEYAIWQWALEGSFLIYGIVLLVLTQRRLVSSVGASHELKCTA